MCCFFLLLFVLTLTLPLSRTRRAENTVIISSTSCASSSSKELSRNNFHISGGATRLPLPAKAQTGGPLRVAGSDLKCGSYLKTTSKEGCSSWLVITTSQSRAAHKANTSSAPNRSKRSLWMTTKRSYLAENSQAQQLSQAFL